VCIWRTVDRERKRKKQGREVSSLEGVRMLVTYLTTGSSGRDRKAQRSVEISMAFYRVCSRWLKAFWSNPGCPVLLVGGKAFFLLSGPGFGAISFG
jgi:hypothetical protein